MPAINDILDQLSHMSEDDRCENLYKTTEEKGLIRRSNLQYYLEHMLKSHPKILMLLEAPGYRGCSKTGIPITSERIMLTGIEKFGLFDEKYRQTSKNPDGVAESSATIFWNALIEHMPNPPLLWNTFVLHPHKRGNTESNRKPTRTEQRTGYAYISQIIELFKINQVLAVGRVAQHSLTEMGIDYIPLRHPSQGGKADFIAGLVESITE